jgi:ribonuclease HII
MGRNSMSANLINDIFVYPSAQFIAGVDEVGRGPLVGAVVTAAVILDPRSSDYWLG